MNTSLLNALYAKLSWAKWLSLLQTLLIKQSEGERYDRKREQCRWPFLSVQRAVWRRQAGG